MACRFLEELSCLAQSDKKLWSESAMVVVEKLVVARNNVRPLFAEDISGTAASNACLMIQKQLVETGLVNVCEKDI
jgi:hypothetical protein